VRPEIDQVICKALTFAERRRLQIQPVTQLTPLGVGEGRLNMWRDWLNHGGRNSAGWRRFLADEKLSKHSLGALASPTILTGNLPWWIQSLRGVLHQAFRRSRPSHYEKRSLDSVARLFVDYARSELLKRLDPRFAGILSSAAESALEDSLLRYLLSDARHVSMSVESISRSVVPELVPDLGELQLLAFYPALARLWMVRVQCWLDVAVEFRLRTKEFLRTHLQSADQKLRSVKSIVPDCSDVHNGNRAVMRIRFANGSEWYYKPRSGRHELDWFNLLRWINNHGFKIPFKTPRVIPRKQHCWMEAVTHRSCRNRREIEAYYFRAGSILYLVDFLRGVDFHAGNLVAHGSQPVLTDCETLSHPKLRISRHVTAGEESSILRTGMLPIRNAALDDGNEVSALGRREFGPHSVRLNRRLVFAKHFTRQIINGFRAMHDFLGATTTRRRGFGKIVERFHKIPCRYVYRPTAQYSWMLEHALSPRLLGDGLDRSLFLEALCRDRLIPDRHIKTEVADLERGDIPIFHGPPAKARYLSKTKMHAAIATLKGSLHGSC
jgi:hypothetical protein